MASPQFPKYHNRTNDSGILNRKKCSDHYCRGALKIRENVVSFVHSGRFCECFFLPKLQEKNGI
jgi:hypothetical protein